MKACTTKCMALLFLLFIVSIDSKAQDQEGPKRVSDFKAYAGVTLSDIIDSGDTYESAGSAGYNLGIAYRTGRLFYWEIGAGVDFAFLFVELGYNRGFSDLIEDTDSRLSQGFLNLGFRF